jgi:hypothetical protein
MYAKSTLPLLFLAGIGCATSHEHAPQTAHATATTPRDVAVQPVPARTKSQAPADQAYVAQLSLEQSEQFEVYRQITELQHAVQLYRQFLERAEGRPELLPAVRKARERIADATDTLKFLRQQPDANQP